jgi:hypothetical protein
VEIAELPTDIVATSGTFGRLGGTETADRVAAVALVDRNREVLETDRTLEIVEEGGVGLEVGSGFLHD